jgi:nitroimidazol reductase NimA-like FMN-containing flavoprotein (pyridoxamine 5'-phosphate oxidase superfamily)
MTATTPDPHAAARARRQAVRMDDAEVAALLEAGKSLQVATIDEDGAPHLVTWWYGLRDGVVVCWTQLSSRTAANLRRDRRAACLVEDGTTYAELRGVSIDAEVELVEDLDGLRTVGRALMARNYPPDEQPDVEPLIAGGARVGVVFHPTRVSSWDHRKLGTSGPRP